MVTGRKNSIASSLIHVNRLGMSHSLIRTRYGHAFGCHHVKCLLHIVSYRDIHAFSLLRLPKQLLPRGPFHCSIA